MSSKKLAEIIAKSAGCDPGDVKPDSELVALGIGSLKAITLLYEIEESFDIEIPNEVIPSIVTVKDIQNNLSRFISDKPE